MMLQIDVSNDMIEKLGKDNVENMIKDFLQKEEERIKSQFTMVSDDVIEKSFRKISKKYDNTLKELAK